MRKSLAIQVSWLTLANRDTSAGWTISALKIPGNYSASDSKQIKNLWILYFISSPVWAL